MDETFCNKTLAERIASGNRDGKEALAVSSMAKATMQMQDFPCGLVETIP